MKKQVNYLVLFVVLVALVFTSIITGCAPKPAPAPTPAPAPAPAPSPAPAPPKEKWPETLLIFGMAAGTSPYLVAAAFGDAINKELGIRTQVTSGLPVPTATTKIGEGEYDIGYSSGDTPYRAFQGLGDWAGKPLRDLRVLSHVNFSPYHFITWPGTGINSAADLKGKTIMGDQVGAVFTSQVTDGVLEANGLTRNDVKVVSWREFGEQTSFIKMKLGDAIIMACVIGTATMAELDRTIKWNFLRLTEKEINAVLKKGSYFLPYTIPVGSYTQLPEAYPTVAMYTEFVVNAKIPEGLVYELCKILYDTPGRFAKVHAIQGEFDIKKATNPRVAPFHAGAIKYYKEKGVWDSEVDKWQKEVLQAAGLTK